jgi:RNA polymerase sigma-70 factor (ECF subfamily)
MSLTHSATCPKCLDLGGFVAENRPGGGEVDDSREDVTNLLLDWRGGDPSALEKLAPLVYEELRRVAEKQMRDERAGHTLQATALVHEAFIRLVRSDVKPNDRVHFFALAARTMRRVLVDHAKGKRRAKRGGGAARIDIEDLGTIPARSVETVLEIEDALARLAEQDPRKVEVIELFHFGGLGYEEIAEVLGISSATVHRELKFARAWLANELRTE